VPRLRKLGHIGRTVNAGRFAYATCCALQTLISCQGKGRGFRILYRRRTADKATDLRVGGSWFLQDLQGIKESRRADSNR
jgi:hypothetical protein